ncbi:MAG: phosphatase PAP2 family protein [Kiloniellales bacterium]
MQTATARLPLGGFVQAPLGVVREHLWLLGLVLAYVLAGALLAWSHGALSRMSLTLYFDRLLVRYALCMVIVGLGYLLHLVVVVRPKALLLTLGNDLRRLLMPERLLAAGLVLSVLPIFISTFTSIKVLIPMVRPFDWDAAFMAWDLWLHGGRHPWEILQPLLGRPMVSQALNMIYHLWFFVLYGIVCWQALSRSNPLLRMQFFLSMLLAWALLGSLAATVFSSAGPCYFSQVTGLPDPFAPLMAYLQAANESHRIWALDVQDALWQGYQDGVIGPGLGISAMPSMHVGAVILSLLLGWRTHRVLGWALALFASLTFLGSVHLGWHYAIDGYAAVLGTLGIWYAVGWLLRRDRYFGTERRAAARPAIAALET